jgi:hypothetical protein
MFLLYHNSSKMTQVFFFNFLRKPTTSFVIHGLHEMNWTLQNTTGSVSQRTRSFAALGWGEREREWRICSRQSGIIWVENAVAGHAAVDCATGHAGPVQLACSPFFFMSG